MSNALKELFSSDTRECAAKLAPLFRDDAGKVRELPWNIKVSLGFYSDAICTGSTCPDTRKTGAEGRRHRYGNCGWCRYFMGANIAGAEGVLGEILPACCGALLYQQTIEKGANDGS